VLLWLSAVDPFEQEENWQRRFLPTTVQALLSCLLMQALLITVRTTVQDNNSHALIK
jgi:hypothetical protein